MKQTPVFGSGSPYTFASTGEKIFNTGGGGTFATLNFVPRHQTYLEGAGILIPPQVQWSLEYRLFNIVTGAVVPADEGFPIACYLFGTRVLLNFNTSI